MGSLQLSPLTYRIRTDIRTRLNWRRSSWCPRAGELLGEQKSLPSYQFSPPGSRFLRAGESKHSVCQPQGLHPRTSFVCSASIFSGPMHSATFSTLLNIFPKTWHCFPRLGISVQRLPPSSNWYGILLFEFGTYKLSKCTV